MENTVFILGAGASCTYGLPTGQRLAEQIIEVASDIESNATHLHKWGGFSENLKGILSEYYRENFIREKLELFAPAFKDFDYPSIDVFLNNTPEFEQIGKFLIAFLILIQEKKEYVNSPPPEYKDRSWPNWMNYLRQAIINNNMGDKSNQNISFVTFNYDRSLEYYLQKVLSRTFPKKEIHIDNYFDIIHVYGKLGNIRKMRDGFELADNDPNSIEYGDWKNVNNFDKAIGNIKLIYETRKNNELISNISIKLNEAKNVYFMGFGFDQLNLDVIGWDATLTNSKNIYGTAFSYRDNEILKIPNQIGYLSAGEKKAVGHNAKKRVIKNIDCLQLLRDYF